jgi:phage shock protein A
MNVWSKLMTALRGGANELGESIIDTQALRILDQEVRDSAEELKNSKDSLAELMARQKVAEQKCTTLNNKIAEYEDYTVQALQSNDETLAQELAEKIADLETQHKTEHDAREGYGGSADNLRNAIKQAESNIKRLKHQVDTVKATENVQRAQAAVAQRHSGSNSKITTAMDSLERIKEKQELKNAQFNAAHELAEDISDTSLQNRLEEAGIISNSSSGDAVLARLKSKVTPQLGSDVRLND